MGFYLNRYVAALLTYKKWALLVLLPPSLYLILAAIGDVTFTVSQNFSSYSGDLPVAAADNPTGTVKLSALVADPDSLFLDGFALIQLGKKLALLEDSHGVADENALRRLTHFTLSLSATGDSRLRLSYTGKDAMLGNLLVSFYAGRLVKRIDDGMARARSSAVPAPPFQATGDVVVIDQHALWSAERLLPAMAISALSALGVMLLIAIFEFSDPSFKSERQIARYLGLPVLGAIPDAEPLVRNLPD